MKNQARGDETKKLFAKIQESSHLEDDVTQCITCYKIASRNRHYLMLRCTIEEKHTSNREIAVPGDNSQAENWSAEDNLAVIIGTAGLNSAQLSEYYLSKGFYPEQINSVFSIRKTS